MREKSPKKKTAVHAKAPKPPLKKIKAAIKKKPAFRDERLAPEVDHDLLLALVRRELPEKTARDVYRFVNLFKSWSDAYCNALSQTFRQGFKGDVDR